MTIRRRTSAAGANVEPAQDTTETKVVIPEGTEAEIIERIGAKTVSYKATVKANEKDTNEAESEMDDDEDFNFMESERIEAQNFATVPKDQIDTLFDYLIENEDGQDFYYAKVTRQPDGFTDTFALPCTVEMSLGVFQFTTRDRFNFIPSLQRLAQSGGRFNVLIFTADQNPLLRLLGYNYERGRRTPETTQVGLRNLLIPNPVITEERGAATGLDNVLLKMAEMQQQNTNAILGAIEKLNRPPEKSVLEKAIEQKMLNDIVNPPPAQSNKIEDTLAAMFAMPVMVEKISAKMFPDSAAPAEPPSTLDKILNNEMLVTKGLDVVSGFGNMLGQITAMKMQQDAQQPAQPQPAQPAQDDLQQAALNAQTNEMAIKQNELINEILVELETNNPIDDSNKKLQQLKAEYPDLFPLVVMACKAQPFDVLLETIGSVVSFDDHGLLDEDGDFNVRGLEIKARLKEFYEFMKQTSLP